MAPMDPASKVNEKHWLHHGDPTIRYLNKGFRGIPTVINPHLSPETPNIPYRESRLDLPQTGTPVQEHVSILPSSSTTEPSHPTPTKSKTYAAVVTGAGAQNLTAKSSPTSLVARAPVATVPVREKVLQPEWTEVVRKKRLTYRPKTEAPVLQATNLTHARPGSRNTVPAHTSSLPRVNPQRNSGRAHIHIPPPKTTASKKSRSKKLSRHREDFDKTIPTDEEFRSFFALQNDEVKELWKIIMGYVTEEKHGMKTMLFRKALKKVGFDQFGAGGHGSSYTFTPTRLKVGLLDNRRYKILELIDRLYQCVCQVQKRITFHIRELGEVNSESRCGSLTNYTLAHDADIGRVELRHKEGSLRETYPAMVRAMYEVWNSDLGFPWES